MTDCAVCAVRLRPSDRRYQGPCSECGLATCPAHTFFYTDESNVAITASARPTCFDHRVGA